MAEPKQELKVKVKRVMYPAETVADADWFIIDTTHGCCKGNMSWRPHVGERLILTGKYTEYQGQRQFAFTEAALDVPTDSRGLLHYVCEMASGVGSTMESDIWARYEEDWPNVEEGALPRFSGKVFDNFQKAMELAESDRTKGKVIAELLSAGATMNMATAAYERWEKETMGVVTSNPYRLAELKGYGFQDVDKSIREYFGILDNDPRRIRAAVLYVLRQITNSGSTLVKWDALNSECLAKLGGFQDLIIEAVRLMFEEGTLRGFEGSKSISLASDYYNETTIWEYISEGDSCN